MLNLNASLYLELKTNLNLLDYIIICLMKVETKEYSYQHERLHHTFHFSCLH